MSDRGEILLICPFDGLALANRGAGLACAKGHTFDRAREGYVNLLPVQDKASKDPGDSKEMVAARRRFLETGAYAPIAGALNDAVVAALERRRAAGKTSGLVTIVDAGCGEGSYLEHLARSLAGRDEAIGLAGIDISKWAVRAAAKRTAAGPRPITWAVASNRRLPFVQSSVDVIVCLFGFPVWDGFAAVQPVGGEVVLIDPGPDHLQELRAIIYPEVKRGVRPALGPQPGYRPVSEVTVTALAHVATRQAIADLLAMTPHAHRATAEGQARLAKLPSLDVTIDVVVRTYARL